MDGIADYEFVRRLGEGNYGDYYLALTPKRLPVDDEFVAVKVVVGPTSDDAYRRATRELRHFATARSPKLVNIYDAGRQADSFYYALEYLPLGSLAAPARPVSPSQVIQAVADAAEAAHVLHEHGIVHRDIKPSNVLLSNDGGKLTDLGLSQLLSPGLVFTGTGRIGLEFTDPAILRGSGGSRATDIWSLGATLHKVLTGHGLYGEQPDLNPLLVLQTMAKQPPEVHPSLEPEVATVVQACIAANPDDRLKTAAEVAEKMSALSR